VQSVAYYPLFLELKEIPCVVIGGGEVAFRKVHSLAGCGAKVLVVSPRLVRKLRQLVKRSQILWRPRGFRVQDLKGARLVVAATDQPSLNERIGRLAKGRGLWVNVVDQPDQGSFIVPSVVRKGAMVLAISTGGRSPALAKWIRQDLEDRYRLEWDQWVDQMGRLRAGVKERVRGSKRRKRLFEHALHAYVRALEESQ